jgi:hypothetical protein
MKKNKSLPILFRSSSLQAISETANFYPKAKQLRNHFEKTQGNPMEAKSERFCWDYWSVPNQYRLLRTPAEPFFQAAGFRNFLEHLLAWGRENLGCQMISQPWLSAYIDGSFQNLHSDVPHGPYSFVFSLTPWEARSFTGGETLVANPLLLRYFGELNPDQSHEEKDFFTRIAPKFNQLTVFDPRYPHGVERVNGVEDLLGSRLVIHGWFTEPRPMLEGSLTPNKAQKDLDSLAHHLLAKFETLPYSGLFSMRASVNASGKITKVLVLASHLIDRSGHVISKKTISKILSGLAEFQFPTARGTTEITLPLLIAPVDVPI